MQNEPTSGLVLRTMTTEDIPGGLRLCRASGWNQLDEDWRLFTDSPSSGGLLIERAAHILGTAAYMRYDALAWVAMMLVDPAERRAGLGARLLAEALAALAARAVHDRANFQHNQLLRLRRRRFEVLPIPFLFTTELAPRAAVVEDEPLMNRTRAEAEVRRGLDKTRDQTVQENHCSGIGTAVGCQFGARRCLGVNRSSALT